MINPLQDINLRHETLLQLLVKPKRSDLFYSNFSSMNLVSRMPHNRKRTGSNLLPNHVVSNHSTAPSRRLRHRWKSKTLKIQIQLRINNTRIQNSVIDDLSLNDGNDLWSFGFDFGFED